MRIKIAGPPNPRPKCKPLPRSVIRSELDAMEKEEVYLIARHYPYDIHEVKNVFIRTGKSFDKTQLALTIMTTHNVCSAVAVNMVLSDSERVNYANTNLDGTLRNDLQDNLSSTPLPEFEKPENIEYEVTK